MTNREKVEYIAGAPLEIMNFEGEAKPCRIRQHTPSVMLGSGDTFDEAWYNALEYYSYARVQDEPLQLGVTREMMGRLDEVRSL